MLYVLILEIKHNFDDLTAKLTFFMAFSYMDMPKITFMMEFAYDSFKKDF